jgi:hypothetical protein
MGGKWGISINSSPAPWRVSGQVAGGDQFGIGDQSEPVLLRYCMAGADRAAFYAPDVVSRTGFAASRRQILFAFL